MVTIFVANNFENFAPSVPEGATFMEFPEARLSARQQWEIGKDLLKQVQSGAELVIMTHSEILVLVFRAAIAQEELPPTAVGLCALTDWMGERRVVTMPISEMGGVSHPFLREWASVDLNIVQLMVDAQIRRSKKAAHAAKVSR